ncbi:hypothetical protein B5M50_03855 [candidate division KSB1 bacterium 4484_219]|nr:MAG: hypothetical protein B5M50_03855 [candidate division KSB1 bacterium 4484_219]
MNRNKKYNRIKLALGIAEFIVVLALLLALVLRGWTFQVGSLARSVTEHPYGIFVIYLLLVGIIELAITFPFSFYSGYIVEHQFGVSNQNFGQWLWEEIKGIGVSGLILLPLFLIFFFFLRSFKNFWWLPVGLIVFLVSILLARLAPVLIFPLFYKFEPLTDESLSKRVILSDTLLENFSLPEIITVFAHELGHYRYHHIWKGILSGFVLTLGGIFVTSLLYQKTLAIIFPAKGLTIDQVEALPLLALYLTLFGLIITPIQNMLSRHFERQADLFALQITKDKESFVSAMEKLAQINLADKEPHPIIEFLFYSHPSIKKRIAMAHSS